VLANDARGTGRGYGWLSLPLLRGRRIPTLTLRAGMTTARPLAQQAFRLGGNGTVRGFDYGSRTGRAFWAAQLDWPITRGVIQPVLFADAGQAGYLGDRSIPGVRNSVIAGGGAGLSILGGVVRFDLSHPITKGGSGLRFDLVMRALVWP
jgi:hemolysin activation/secretion protein